MRLRSHDLIAAGGRTRTEARGVRGSKSPGTDYIETESEYPGGRGAPGRMTNAGHETWFLGGTLGATAAGLGWGRGMVSLLGATAAISLPSLALADDEDSLVAPVPIPNGDAGTHHFLPQSRQRGQHHHRLQRVRKAKLPRAGATPTVFENPNGLGFFPPPFHLHGHLLPPGYPGPRNDRNRPRRAGFEFRLAPGGPLKKAQATCGRLRPPGMFGGWCLSRSSKPSVGRC